MNYILFIIICYNLVVSTIVSDILFAHFRTVQSISKIGREGSFLFMTSYFEKCACWRWRHNVLERKWSKSGTFSFISLFHSLWRHKESCIWSEYARLYGNEQKRTSDTIVKTTSFMLKKLFSQLVIVTQVVWHL